MCSSELSVTLMLLVHYAFKCCKFLNHIKKIHSLFKNVILLQTMIGQLGILPN